MTVSTDLSCALPRPDIAELSEAVRTELSKRLLGGAPVLPLSSEDILAFVMAGTVNLMWGFVSQSLKEQDPALMCCDNLVIYAARRGINLHSATRAKGYVALSGDPNSAIPPTLRFIGEASREYKLDPGVTYNPTNLDSTGRAVVRVVSTIGAGLFNIGAGATLTVSTTVPGIDMEAMVVGNGITGGSNDEDCEPLRQRVLDAEASDVISLNEAWYIRETLKYPGVTRACTDQCQGCCDPTFMSIYPFMEGVYGEDYTIAPYGLPPCDVLDEMSDWMFGQGRGQGLAPIGIRGRYQQALPTRLNVTAYCFSACPIGAVDRIKAALWQYIRAMYCVGSTICKDHLRAVVMQALGQNACVSNIEFQFENPIRFEDAANAYLDCGQLLVLGDVSLQEGSYHGSAVPAATGMRAVPAPSVRAKPVRT